MQLYKHCFSSNVESFQSLFLWTFFYSPFFLSSDIYILVCLMGFHISLRLFISPPFLFPLFFRLLNIYQYIFKFIDSSAISNLLLSPSSEFFMFVPEFTFNFFLVSISLYDFVIDPSYVGLWPSLRPHLNLITSVETLSSNKFIFWSTGGWDLHEFGRVSGWEGHTIQPITEPFLLWPIPLSWRLLGEHYRNTELQTQFSKADKRESAPLSALKVYPSAKVCAIGNHLRICVSSPVAQIDLNREFSSCSCHLLPRDDA